MKLCVINECGKPWYCRNWCEMHYYRWRRHGDPYKAIQPQGPPEQRFWAKVVGGDVTECWLWQGSLVKGYGSFGYAAGRTTGAHRWAYTSLIADIPHGLELDYLCETSDCVNPWHLDPVPHEINKARTQTRKTHCPQNHPYDDQNTFYERDGSRKCRACRKESERRRDRRKKVVT